MNLNCSIFVGQIPKDVKESASIAAIVTGSDGASEATTRLKWLYRDLDHLYEVISISNKIFVEYLDPCLHFDATVRCCVRYLLKSKPSSCGVSSGKAQPSNISTCIYK